MTAPAAEHDSPTHSVQVPVNHSHVSGVALQFQDGGGEAEPLVTVSSENVPLRDNVVCGSAHKLVAISTPAKHPENQSIIITGTFKYGLDQVSYTKDDISANPEV